MIKKYQIVYADPAWSYNDKKCNGNAQDHYKTMSIQDICNLPVGGVTDNNCVLFLWGINKYISEGTQVKITGEKQKRKLVNIEIEKYI